MHENPKLTIAIDGPSGSGKSSVSKEVARHFGLAYLDTGAMYRAATYRVLELGIDLNDAEAIAKAAKEMPSSTGMSTSSLRPIYLRIAMIHRLRRQNTNGK